MATWASGRSAGTAAGRARELHIAKSGEAGRPYGTGGGTNPSGRRPVRAGHGGPGTVASSGHTSCTRTRSAQPAP